MSDQPACQSEKDAKRKNRKAFFWGFVMGILCFTLASAALCYFFSSLVGQTEKIIASSAATIAPVPTKPHAAPLTEHHDWTLAEVRQDQSRQGLETAKKSLEEGDLVQAGLFFSNALAYAPQKLEIITGYTDAVIKWQQRQAADGNSKHAAVPLIPDMISLLNRQVVYVTPPEMPALMAAISRLKQLEPPHEQSGERHFFQPVDQALVAKAEALLQSPLIVTPANMEAQDKEVAALITELETGNSTDQVAGLLSRLEDRRQNIQKLSDIFTAFNRAREFLKNAEAGDSGSDFTAYYMAAADSILRQIISLQGEVSGFNRSIPEQLAAELDRVSKEIFRKKSAKELDKVVVMSKNISKFEKISTECKCQEALEAIAGFLNDAQPVLVAITDPDIGKQAKEIVSRNGALLTRWRTEQQDRYDQWALKAITYLYREAKPFIGKLTSEKDSIKVAMRHWMDDIDPRLLSSAASRAYSEVYELFVHELDNDQKIEMAQYFTVSSKKGLADF